jgi:hypothetical protein
MSAPTPGDGLRWLQAAADRVSRGAARSPSVAIQPRRTPSRARLARTASVGALVVAVLAASSFAVIGTAGAASRADNASRADEVCPSGAPDSASARAAAMRCGGRIEAMDGRTEKAQIFAEPSGTMTLEATAVPVRVRRSDGSWAAVDPTLGRSADGSIVPAATTAAVRFSGGGTGPLVSVDRAGHSWTLSWPAALPAPVLAGDTAAYPEVLPGVDLVVRATADGFTHVLVVKDRTAAANPALRAVRYRAAGGSAQTTPEGGIVFTAADGSVLVSAGGAAMWDSTGEDTTAEGPGLGSKRADVSTKLVAGELVLTPDQALLTGAGTRFPVYLDPPFTAGASKWTYTHNNNVNNSDGKAWVGEDPTDLTVYRSFFDFGVSALRGTHVLSASLEAKLYHSWSCGSTPVYLYRTNNVTATPRATWSTMHLNAYLDTKSAHAHKGSNACGNQADVVMWFNGNLTTDVQAGATANWTVYTVGFCACSAASGTGEGTTDRWKKFYPNTVKLHVTYNSYPATPSGLATVPTSTCATGAARPAINTWTPQLKAALTDVDAGSVLRADFAYSVNGGTTWTPLPRTGAQATGLTHTVPMPDVSGSAPAFVSWRVRAWDGTDLSKAWSATCEFAADTTPPGDPILDPGAALPPYPTAPPSIVVVGSPVPVPVAPAAGDTDVVGYWYAVSTAQVSPPRQTFVTAAANGTATLQVTPVVSGLSANWLTVQAIDRAGNVSTEVTYLFRANPTS